MRIASTMMTNNYLKQLNGTYEQYTNLMEQSDGDKLHRSSDDCVGYSKYLRYQNNLIGNEQFSANVKTAASWMKNSDSALVNVTDLLQTFKAKVEQAANSPNNESDMKDIAKELLANVQEQVADLNTQIGDRYLFSGQSDTTCPFQISNEKKARGETKTLDDRQAAFFSGSNGVSSDTTVKQMLKMKGQNATGETAIFYLNVKNGDVYTEDFVENGYKDEKKLDPATQRVGNVGAVTVSDFFDQNGVINAAGLTKNYSVTSGGYTLSFSTTQQYIVEYKGDAKYISMVKKTGGVDQATDTVNVTGQDLFGTDIFDDGLSPASGTAMLNELLYSVAKIDAADYKWAGKDGMTIADTAHASVLGAETKMAARQQAYTAASSMLTTQNWSITGDIADVHSTDVAKLATKLMEYQTIYSLSLSVGSKILPGTLADYLR